MGKTSGQSSLSLTAKRRGIISYYSKNADVEQVGSEDWCLRLVELMKKYNEPVTLADVKHWMLKNKWFKSLLKPKGDKAMSVDETPRMPTLSPQVSPRQHGVLQGQGNEPSPSPAVQDIPQLNPHDPQNLIPQATHNEQGALPSERPAVQDIRARNTRAHRNLFPPESPNQQGALPSEQPTVQDIPGPNTRGHPNLIPPVSPNLQGALPSEQPAVQDIRARNTRGHQNLTPPESPNQLGALPSERPAVQDIQPPNPSEFVQAPSNPIPEPSVSTTSGNVERSAPYWGPESRVFGDHHYYSGFSSIQNLYNIFSEMPNLRWCLIPLQSLERLFIRNYRKHMSSIVCPTGYEELRKKDPRIDNLKEETGMSTSAVPARASGDVVTPPIYDVEGDDMDVIYMKEEI